MIAVIHTAPIHAQNWKNMKNSGTNHIIGRGLACSSDWARLRCLDHHASIICAPLFFEGSKRR
jgi:hypothetical protein